MGMIKPDPQTGSPIFMPDDQMKYGSTDSFSGSAVVPSYQPSAYRNVSLYNEVFSDDDEKQKSKNKLRDFYFQRLRKDAAIEEDIYKTQKTYGIFIFIVSILLVLSGILFSIWQLKYAMGIGDVSQFESSLEIEAAGRLMITTSSIGAFVLVLSLVFFFLFLQFVYKPNSKRKKFYKNILDANTIIEN